MRVQMDIEGLRDDAFENEKDRQQALTDLAEDTARRREAIEQDHQRRLEDLHRRATDNALESRVELERDIADLLTGSTAEQRASILSGVQSGFDVDTILSQIGFDLDDDTRGDLADLLRDFQRESEDAFRQQVFDEQGLGIRRDRAEADLVDRIAQRREEINTQANATANAIQVALDPLLSQTTPTAMLESQTAMTNSETAMVASANATRTAEITGVMETNTEQDTANIENFSTRLTDFQTGGRSVGRKPPINC